MTYAGADRRGYRTERRRAERDIEFLATLRVASLDDLLAMWRRFNHATGPKWKRVALERAIRREQGAAPIATSQSSPTRL